MARGLGCDSPRGIGPQRTRTITCIGLPDLDLGRTLPGEQHHSHTEPYQERSGEGRQVVGPSHVYQPQGAYKH